MIDTSENRGTGGATELRVRPYVLTGGRVESDSDLALEAILASTDLGRARLGELHLEHEELVRLCQDSVSLTELAAHIGLPVQVVRVLAGDLIADGLLEVAAASVYNEDRPDLGLLERVLDGLQSL